MNNIVVVVDSVACLLREHIDKYGIKVVPLNVHFDGVIYRDGIDINPEKAYEFLERAPDLFSTSPASPEEYTSIFREVCNKGSNIICFTMSSKISTMYNVANIAKDMVENEIIRMSIEIVDSKTVTASEGLLALETAKFIGDGGTFSAAVQFAKEAREKVGAVFTMETLKYVYRTGRIPKVASKIGSMLPIKPIIIVRDGAAHISGFARTKNGSIDRVIKTLKTNIGDNPVKIAVMHGQIPEEGKELKNRITSEFNCEEAFLTEFSPIMGYATGRGALGLAYYSE